METFIVALILLLAGFLAAFSGYVLFRLMLPIMGFVVGFGVGFSGVQAVFGSNVWSYTAALVTAIIVALIFAAVSYLYYTVGVMVIVGSIVAGAFAFLGNAIGLSEDGFIVFLLSLTGAIAGGIAVLRTGLQHSLVVSGTALFGVAAMLTGAYLLFGDLSLADFHQNGILRTIGETVTSSWLWLFVLIGGTVLATAIQHSLIARAIIDSPYAFEESKK